MTTPLRLSEARAVLGVDPGMDEMPPPDAPVGTPESQFLGALAELAEAAAGLASAYLYSADPGSLDPEIACYAQKVAVKASGELARMQLWLHVPLSAGPDAD